MATTGARAAFQALGLVQYVGRSADELLAGVMDRLAPAGADLEQGAARSALTNVLADLFEERGVFDGGIDGLNGLTESDAREIVERFVAQYINERLLQVLAGKLEDRAATDVVRLEQEVWDYVKNTVRLDLSDIDVLTTDWDGAEGTAIVERIFTEGYRIIERG